MSTELVGSAEIPGPGDPDASGSADLTLNQGTRTVCYDLTWADIETGGRVALISEEFARELGPTPQAALGKRIRTVINTDDYREVIGVVESVKEDDLYRAAPSVAFSSSTSP